MSHVPGSDRCTESLSWWLLLSLILITTCIHGEDDWAKHGVWNYDITSKFGPYKWNESWPDCSGGHQSPIDIDSHHVWFTNSLTTLEMINYESIPPNTHWELVNVGHAVHLELESDYRLRDGGLPGEYKAMYLTFHWGPTNTTGSEHTIDGRAYAMEIQVVHYNLAYGSYEAATAHTDGIAIISFLVQTKSYGNPSLSQIINNLANITEQGSSVSLRPLPLLSLFPINTNEYYRYEGSLTTPPCLPVVQWTVFSDIAIISEKQLATFRTFRSQPGPEQRSKHHARLPTFKNHGGLGRHSTGQCRPLQPIYDRTIYTSDNKHATLLTSNSGTIISIVLAFSLGFLIIILTATRPIKTEDFITNHED